MDRREREALQWINKQLVESGLPKIERFQRSRVSPVLRIFSRLLEATNVRSPGSAQFSSTDTHYRYWRALRLMEGAYPPTVVAFNRAWRAGEYPHLTA